MIVYLFSIDIYFQNVFKNENWWWKNEKVDGKMISDWLIKY